MTNPELDPLEVFIRKAGADLEDAHRAAGTPLPPGLSGEQLARSVIEDLRRDKEKWAPEFQTLEREVRSELPPGAPKEDYIARLSAKVEDWLRNHPDFLGPGPHAA